MAYDEALAERIRALLEAEPTLSERKMFGGIAFMLGGNMACGANTDGMMVRVGPDAYEDALALDGASEMDFTGRPMRGWVSVDMSAVESDQGLEGWVERGASFARSLPVKG